MRRVLVVGAPGAGKSTVARALARVTGSPLIHLDRRYWRPGWVPADKETWRREVAAMTEGEKWIIDGNYSSTLDIRLAAADTVILLDFPTRLCLRRVLRRTIVSMLGGARDDMADGCRERLDPAFILCTARFRKTFRPPDEARLAAFGGTVHRFGSPGELKRFLDELPHA